MYSPLNSYVYIHWILDFKYILLLLLLLLLCLIASNEQDLQMVFDGIRGCISEYGMKVNERKICDLCKWSEERENVEFLRKYNY